MAVLEAGDGAEGRVVARAALELLEPMPVPVLESFGASSAFFPSPSLFLVESSSFPLFAAVVAEVLLRENLESEGVRLVLEPVIATGGVAGGRFGGLVATETAPLAEAIAKTVYSSGPRSRRVRQCLSSAYTRQPPKRTDGEEGKRAAEAVDGTVNRAKGPGWTMQRSDIANCLLETRVPWGVAPQAGTPWLV